MRKLGLITSLILVSYVLGLAFAQYALPDRRTGDPRIERDPAADTAPDTANLPTEEPNKPGTAAVDPSVQVAADRLAIGDSRLLADDPAGALKDYEVLLAQVPTSASAPLRYRVALCAEFLGKLDRAMNEYGRLVNAGSDNRIAVAAQLGRARIWRDSNRPVEARRAVWTVLLASRVKERDSTEFQAEYVHQLGQLLAHQTARREQGELLSELAIVDPPVQRSLREALHWIVDDPSEMDSHVSDADEAEDTADAPVRLTQQLGPAAEETYLDAKLPRMPVAAAVELLAGTASFEVEWSTAARDRISEHTVQIAVPETALAILLDGVSDLMDLVWEGGGGAIRLRTRQEAGEEFTRRFDLDAAERMLRRATAAFPDHELADDAYWALGNIGVRRGGWEAAILQYEQFLRQFPRSAARVGVHFNLAKTRLRSGNRDEAMQHFYHVVDEAPAGRLQPIAFLYLGRLYLEDDRAKPAIRPLTRSLASARDDALRATAAIALASAYLLLENPHAANRILMAHRSAFGQGPHYDQAALLAALARHQAASTANQVERTGRPLLDAATHVGGADFFGTYGFVILAEAYQRLGLFEAVQSTLLQGLEVVPRGGLRSRMMYALADYHHDAGNMVKCKELLATLAIDDAGEAWAGRAKLRLAEVLGAEGDDEQCLALCRELLQGTSQPGEQQKVLETMGRVFERQGSHRAAALCFAGIEPGIAATGQQRTMR